VAHDPDCRDEHAEVSRAGVGSVLLQAIRLLRERETDVKLNATVDKFVF